MSGQVISVHKSGKNLKKSRAVGKGRQVDMHALAEVQGLLGDEPRRKDLLIEHLHKIHGSYKHISACHLVAISH